MSEYAKTVAAVCSVAVTLYLTECTTLLFFFLLWFFPERMVGVIILCAYLLVWLPYSLLGLPFHIHAVLLALYFLFPLPEMPGFRAWRGWDAVRRMFYPVVHAENRPRLKEGTLAVYTIAPHGVYAENVHLGMVLNDKFLDVVPVGSSLMSWIPMAKDFCAICGVIQATKRDMIRTLVERKRSIMLVPEGIRGILHEKNPNLVPRRSGFVECAVEAGATIVPVYMRNAWSMYAKWPVIDKDSGLCALLFNRMQHRMLSSCLKYPFLLCWGQFGGYFPLFSDKPLIVEYGEPIVCKKLSHADPQFKQYVARIVTEYYEQQDVLAAAAAAETDQRKTIKKE